VAYLRNFDPDIFISYAKSDDDRHSGEDVGWIDRLVRELRMEMKSFVARDVSIWFDSAIEGDAAFADQVKEKLSRARILVVVISPRYLHSEWARRELKAFAGGGISARDVQSRIFVIEKISVPPDEIPAEIRNIKRYRFHESDPSQPGRSRELRPLGPDGSPGPDAPYYYKLIDELARDIAKHLVELARLESTELSRPSDEQAPSQSGDAGTASHTGLRQGRQPYIYIISDSNDRSSKELSDVIGALTQAGFYVETLPGDQARQRADFDKAIKLADGIVFFWGRASRTFVDQWLKQYARRTRVPARRQLEAALFVAPPGTADKREGALIPMEEIVPLGDAHSLALAQLDPFIQRVRDRSREVEVEAESRSASARGRTPSEPPPESSRASADIFFSYASADRDWAFWIAHELEAMGHVPHIHEWEIPAGGDITEWMEQRFDSADYVLCVVSRAYFEKSYAALERQAAVWMYKRPGLVLPVFIEPCETPPLFAPLKRCDLYDVSEEDARTRLRNFVGPGNRAQSAAEAQGSARRVTIFPRRGTLSNIPIVIPRQFVGRDGELKVIAAALAKRDDRAVFVALHGLRGVGKTTLAAALAEWHRGDYRATWWIRAETEQSVRADLVGLGVRLGWVTPDENEVSALAIVMERLRDEGDRILLIYDNAVDASGLRPYLPRGGAAHVLITSNSSNWRGVAEPVAIAPWPTQIGADYLIARTGRTAERDAAEALSQALGGLPIAIEQAAVYCERLEVSLGDYLKRFEAAPASMLDDGGGDRTTVAKTFAVTIDEAAKLHPSAEPLIVHAALLAPEPIPLFLFAEAHEQFDQPFASTLTGDGLARAVEALRTFDLVDRAAIADDRDPAITTVAIYLHPLVRQVVAGRCDEERQREIRRALINALSAVFPTGAYERPDLRARCAVLMPHLLAICEATSSDLLVEAKRADLLDRVSDYLGERRSYEPAARQSLLASTARNYARRLFDAVAFTYRRRHQIWRIATARVEIVLPLLPLVAALALKLMLSNGSRPLVDGTLGSRAHASEVTAMIANGDAATTASYDGSIKFWDINSWSLARTLALAGPNPIRAQSGAPPATSRTPVPMAIARDTDGSLIVMTDLGIARDAGKGNIAVATDRPPESASVEPSVGRGPPVRTVLGAAEATGTPYAVARNWSPGVRGAAPFVALAVPAGGKVYALGTADGRVALETAAIGGTAARFWWRAGIPGTPPRLLRADPPAGSPSHNGPVTALAVTADGKLASVADDGSVILWTLNDGQWVSGRGLAIEPEVKVIQVLREQDSVLSAIFSPDGKRIATTSRDGTARIWDAATGQVLQTFAGHADTVISVSFSPDGQRMITASSDKTARIWDVVTSKEIAVLRGHENAVRSAAFSPDGRRVVTASLDNTARVWDTRTARQLQVVRHTAALNSAAFSPDGSRIVTASDDDTSRIWEVTTGRQILTPLAHLGAVTSAAFSPDGVFVVTSSRDKTARIWESSSGRMLQVFRAHTDGLNSAMFSPDRLRIVTASSDGTARIWDVASGREIEILRGHDDAVLSAAFSPDGKFVVTGSRDKTARIWSMQDANSGTRLCTACSTAAFSADGKRLITAGGAGSFQIWNAESGDLIRALEHGAAVNVARLSADGLVAITAGDDGAARLWDVNDGRLLAIIRGHGEAITQAELTQDGRYLVTAARDGTVRVTSLSQAEWLNYFDVLSAYRRYVEPSIAALFQAFANLRDGVARAATPG
jgi:WD40 repeat protein